MTLAKELGGVVGKDNVLQREEDLFCYSRDASGLIGKVDIVVMPHSTEEIAQILKIASMSKTPVVVRGAGTNRTGGTIPLGGIILDLSGMNSILEFKDSYVISEPGVVLEDLERFLNEKGKTFPVMPASDKACTIGGCIAEDAAGVKAIKYGTTKDWVQELEVVLPDGKVIKTDGKEFCGSEGILGVITEAKLGVTDMPKERSLTVMEFSDIEKLVEGAMELKDSGVSSLEFVSKLANEMLDSPLGKENILLAEYEDNQGRINGEEMARIVEKRKSISTQLAKKGYVETEDPKIPLDRMVEFLQEMEKLGLPVYGHVGIGIVHPRFDKREQREKIMKVVEKVGGNPTGEHGIGILKKEYHQKKWLIPLKKKYDPKGILNPGKVLGKQIKIEFAEVESCAICGICRGRCPVFRASLSETDSPRGKVLLEERGTDGEFLYRCTLCGICNNICPLGTDISDLILEGRERMIKKGKETEANRRMIQNIRKYRNPFGKLEKGEIPKELYCC